MNKLFLVFISLLVGLLGCTVSKNYVKYDYTYLYDSDQKIINPKYKIFHSSQDSSTLFFELLSDDILYGRIPGDTSLKARLKIKYHLYASHKMENTLDSNTIDLVNFGNNSDQKTIQSSIKFKAASGTLYFMVIRFRDVNKDINVQNTFYIDKRLNLNSQFFKLSSNNAVLIEEIQTIKKPVKIEKSALVQQNEFVIEQSSKSFSMTPPPFVRAPKEPLDLQLDTAFVFNFSDREYLLSNLNTINRIIPRGDTSNLYSYFYNYYDGFPNISRLEQMIDPIRYISTSTEYKEVKAAVNTKKALDNFWLKLAKDEDRAKKMIKEYYSRIEIANKHFTSYKEGWKTDRGIIYTIYGNPTSINKNHYQETWIYGEENNILSVKYVFYKNDNDLTFNDYILQRDSDYKNNWYRAVDLWRQAKIY